MTAPMTPFAPPALRHLCDLRVELAAPVEAGAAPAGRFRIIPIVGGQVEGERLAGRILAIGADWQTVRADGCAELDARYAIETHDGATVEVHNLGLRHGPPDVVAALMRGEPVAADRYYMRTRPRFNTGDPRYGWLNRVVAIATGAREAQAVRLTCYEVL